MVVDHVVEAEEEVEVVAEAEMEAVEKKEGIKEILINYQRPFEKVASSHLSRYGQSLLAAFHIYRGRD
jgi:hypothetical protein